MRKQLFKGLLSSEELNWCIFSHTMKGNIWPTIQRRYFIHLVLKNPLLLCVLSLRSKYRSPWLTGMCYSHCFYFSTFVGCSSLRSLQILLFICIFHLSQWRQTSSKRLYVQFSMFFVAEAYAFLSQNLKLNWQTHMGVILTKLTHFGFPLTLHTMDST